MSKSDIRFIHFRRRNRVYGCSNEILSHGGATIAWFITPDGVLVVGEPALCHNEDRFNKALGREVAGNKPAIVDFPSEYIKAAFLAEQSAAIDACLELLPSTAIQLIEVIAGRLIDGVDVIPYTWYEEFIQRHIGFQQNYETGNLEFYNTTEQKISEMTEEIKRIDAICENIERRASNHQ